MAVLSQAWATPIDQVRVGPGMMLSEFKDCYLITAALPGLSMPELKVAVAPGLVTVMGRKPSSTEDPDEAPFAGYFNYNIGLPADIDEQHVTGWFEDDTLTLAIGRQAVS